jgi:DeoR family transcriptional regulator, glycerol-3-phosphate regulon repressor
MTESTDRHARIVDIVAQKGRVSVEELAQLHQVSHETIRRDLVSLDRSRLLRRFHGGAAALSADQEGPFSLRMTDHVEEKRRIARRAASLFGAGDSLFIDTGSTTQVFAEELARVQGLTLITNSQRIAQAVARSSGSEVLMIGGSYRPEARECLGPLAIEQIRRLNAQHCVLTIAALDAEKGAMDFDIGEAEVARAMIERSERLTIIADASKFERRALMEVCPLEAVDRIVTDRLPAPALAAALRAAEVEVIVAS